MFFLSYLFSPTGRFRRLDYNFIWMALGLLSFIGDTLFILLGAEMGFLERNADGSLHTSTTNMVEFTTILTIFLFILGITAFVISLISGIKRAHDLGYSAWTYLFVFFIFPVGFFFLMLIWLLLKISATGILIALAAVLAILMLFFWIKLMFVAGKGTDNEYGMPPFSSDHPVKFKHVFLAISVLIGASLLLAYPAYLVRETLPVRPASADS
jgi:uncharacterized membrane protein YhaH (DUF805 family)